jgi:hypothetical protein
MLDPSPTMLRSTRFLALAAFLVALWVSRSASAQSVSQSGQINPDRVQGNGPPSPLRPLNLNPTGVNFLDCENNMTLSFNLILSNFDGSELVQVWAGTSDCSTDTSRGHGGVPSCWLVGQPMAGIVAGAAVGISIPVRVQDLVGHVNSPPQTPTYVPVGADACRSQTVDTAQSITIFFLPTTSAGLAINNSGAYQYPVKADLVGPPAPTNVSTSVGDTLFTVNWTPSIDADTAGYDVFIDPIPGQEEAGAAPVGAEQILVCTDAGSTAPADATDGADAALDDAISGADGDESGADATLAPSPVSDASPVCIFVTSGGGGTGASSTCGSTVLAGNSTVLDASTTTTVLDEAGNVIDASTTTGGGISTIPPQNIVGAGPSGVTVSDKSTSSFTITQLQNGVTYNVVVAGVDGSGNVGPQSDVHCDSPAPVDDFWKTYRQAGGQAGGGFCALEAVGEPASSFAGMAILVGSTVLAVRRRRRPRSTSARAARSGEP